ncbi:terminase small subunit [Psychrobacillus psychrodurans]|uniref:terminase small subunit n=1 Tax=Psychrobacillus psychrodurans TaxID=126157 RepID=UPI001F4EA8B3|nr:terminase small subunit [Psychrobacillus psychrodurans]MCK1996808.1 terminase small subunit [Psychrobacillus psychrodurans]
MSKYAISISGVEGETYMARARSPERDKAFELYKQSKGERLLKDIAAELEVSDTQIRKWKNLDKWEDQLKGNVPNSKGNVPNEKKVTIPTIESSDLNDKQKLFCLYYLKYFNATKAYQKAYECNYITANVNGSRLLVKASVQKEIDKIKAEQSLGIKLDVKDIIQKYIDIAFADISDFVSFGIKKVQHVVPTGEDAAGNIIYTKTEHEYNYVDFKNHDEVDGTILTEIKQGKEGISVKLADKMKALEMLAKYTDILNDNQLKRLKEEQAKVGIEKTKVEIDKISNGGGDDSPIEIVISSKKSI